MKRIAFTICSNNYLGAAKVLIDSLKVYHPELDLYIGLVDKQSSSIDYDSFGCTILPVSQIDTPDLNYLSSKFNIVELNTTVKPFYFKHFFFELGASQVIYLDPDIKVFSYMNEVIKGLQESMITLTPHMLSPIDDEFGPNDYNILRTGIFNLGFIALSQAPQLPSFLDWWAARCVKYGFRRDAEGMFYDQIWMNYVPVFYKSHYIIRDPGYNIANWNLHERILSIDEKNNWVINDKYSLAFFHFSHFNIEKPEIMSSYNTRFNFNNRPDVLPLFKNYCDEVISNHGIKYKRITPYYKNIYETAEGKRLKEYYTFKRRIINKVTGILDAIIPN